MSLSDDPPHTGAHWVPEETCRGRHERTVRMIMEHRDQAKEATEQLRERIEVVAQRAHDASNAVMTARGREDVLEERIKVAERRPLSVGSVVSILALLVGLIVSGVAAWIASGERLTRIEVRVDAVTTALERVTHVLSEQTEREAAADAAVAGRLGGIEAMVRALDDRLRRLETRRTVRHEAP